MKNGFLKKLNSISRNFNHMLFDITDFNGEKRLLVQTQLFYILALLGLILACCK